MQNVAIPTNSILFLGARFLFWAAKLAPFSSPLHYELSEWSTLWPILPADSLSVSPLCFGHLPKRNKTYSLADKELFLSGGTEDAVKEFPA